MNKIFVILSFLLAGTFAHAQRYYLSGVDSDSPKQWDFLCSAGQNAGKWKKIGVPSCWELQGFGEYTYGRFYKTKGAVPSSETGTYRTFLKRRRRQTISLSLREA